METKLKKVREKIIAAVPSIMELKFGCEIRIKEGSRYHEEMKKAYGTSFFYNGRSLINQMSSVSLIEMTERSGDYEILGRKILAQDVLRALPYFWMIKSTEEGYDLINMNKCGTKSFKNEFIMWHGESLEDQPEQTINRLYDLLV